MSNRRTRSERRRLLRLARRTQPGAMPGTIAVDPCSLPPEIHVVAYSDHELVERPIAKVEELVPLLEKWPVTWVNVDGLGDAAVLKQLGDLFGLHALALEDVVNVHQRAKVEQYGDHLFIVARMVTMTERLETEQVSIFLGPNFVLTFQEHLPGDSFDPVRDRLRRSRGRIRALGPDYLAYSLLDAVIDAYFPVLETYGERVEDLEDEVLREGSETSLTHIHDVKRDLLLLRRAIWPQREAINMLARDASPLIKDDTRLYLRDCYDHTVQLIDLLETYRELGSDLRDLYLSSISNRMNEIMKVLTVISTIFIPLNFIAGVYGMNFHPEQSPYNMPELNWRYGYPFALSLMFAVATTLLYFFRRAGWLGGRRRKPRVERGLTKTSGETGSCPVPAKAKT